MWFWAEKLGFLRSEPRLAPLWFLSKSFSFTYKISLLTREWSGTTAADQEYPCSHTSVRGLSYVCSSNPLWIYVKFEDCDERLVFYPWPATGNLFLAGQRDLFLASILFLAVFYFLRASEICFSRVFYFSLARDFYFSRASEICFS